MLKNQRARLWAFRSRYESLNAHLIQLSPLAVLSRGYAIVEDGDGHVLRSADETAPGQALRIRLHQGKLAAMVSQVEIDADGGGQA